MNADERERALAIQRDLRRDTSLKVRLAYPSPPTLTKTERDMEFLLRLIDFDGPVVDHHKRDEAWNVCHCGKEIQISRKRVETDKEWDIRKKLAEHTTCKSCGYDFSRETDSCPETVVSWEPHLSVSGCRLGWHHEGRCEPHEFDTDAIPRALTQKETP